MTSEAARTGTVTTSEAALRPFTIPGEARIWVLGALERNVSIQLQQVRALNLVWALSSTGRLRAGDRLMVVGGGFAGLTAAAAAGRLGLRVTLVERGREFLALQRRNRTRFIHPHIHEWPRPEAEQERAGLPLLDWGAGLSADMAAEVLAGFEAEAARSAITVELGAPPVDLSRATAEGHVILALGLGVERSFGSLPLTSYWMDDQIATPVDGRPVRHLVSGIGEGGVIDVLYLAIQEFSHAAIARALRDVDGMATVREALLAIEAEAPVDALDTAAANALLTDRYAAVPVPPAVDTLLRARRRADTDIVLNGPERHPLSPKADVLNRFLISRLLATGLLAYRPGKIAACDGDDAQGWTVTLDDGATIACDRIHMRHGTVPALAAAYPSLWERYAPARRALPFDVPARLWPAGYFR
jgi:hypothetical protein